MELSELKPSISQMSRDDAMAIYQEVRIKRLDYKKRAVAKKRTTSTKSKPKKKLDVSTLNKSELTELMAMLEKDLDNETN